MHEEPTRKRRYRLVPRRRVSQQSTVRSQSFQDLDVVALAVFGKPRQELIEEAAYYRWLQRHGGPADADADWAKAEQEIDRLLRETRVF